MTCELKNLLDLFGCATRVFNAIIPIIITMALIVFLIGLYNYINNGPTFEKGRDLIMYGLFGLFVMVSVWGLVGFLTNTFFGSEGPAQTLPVPKFPVSR